MRHYIVVCVGHAVAVYHPGSHQDAVLAYLRGQGVSLEHGERLSVSAMDMGVPDSDPNRCKCFTVERGPTLLPHDPSVYFHKSWESRLDELVDIEVDD